MPILAQEPSVFPDELLSDDYCETSYDRVWWAVYTKSRQEKALARQLFSSQIPFFLPLVPMDRVTRGRRLRSFVPIFNGYLFLFGSKDERLATLTTNRISRILPVTDQTGMLRDLAQIDHLIKSDAPLSVERRLQPGRAIRIKNGPLRGIEGIVEKRRGRDHLIVSIRYLQQGVSVEIDDVLVEPL